MHKHKLKVILMVTFLVFLSGVAMAQTEKPNIVIIWGDDIGQSKLSAYTRGLMGYQTPNIDRVAREGMILPTTMQSRAAPPAGRPSLPVRAVFAPD